MLKSVLTGFIAAVIVFLPRYIFVNFPQLDWSSPVFILAIGAIAVFFRKFLLNSRAGGTNYNGVADLYMHIHTPFKEDSPLRWLLHGIISFLLVLFGGMVGPEGPATEWVQAIRMKMHYRSSRWFEQKRRTDASFSLSAGISAAFGAPFAGALLPMELGLGGQAISVVTSSISAFWSVRFLMNYFSLQTFDVTGILSGFHFPILREWVSVAVIGVACGLVGVLCLWFIRYTQEGLLNLFQTQVWMRLISGACLLALVQFIYRRSSHSFRSPGELLEQVLWMKHSSREVAYYFCAQLLSLTLVLSGLGTVGVFWPILALGGYFGFCVNHWVLGGPQDFSVAAGLAGATGFWAAILDLPLTGAVLVFEMTQSIYILLPCLVAGAIAQQVRKLCKTPSMIESDLNSQGLSLLNGRSASILSSIKVKDAMVTDHEMVHEKESVADLQIRILNARYPFLLVVNTQGVFVGMLTLDAIQTALKSEAQLSKLLEAKDLLYWSGRRGFKSLTVKSSDKLSEIGSVFDDMPCAPVVGEEGRVVGLIFSHGVRLAYDREVARRSFSANQRVNLDS